jgi:hypothetical protein
VDERSAKDGVMRVQGQKGQEKENKEGAWFSANSRAQRTIGQEDAPNVRQLKAASCTAHTQSERWLRLGTAVATTGP